MTNDISSSPYDTLQSDLNSILNNSILNPSPNNTIDVYLRLGYLLSSSNISYFRKNAKKFLRGKKNIDIYSESEKIKLETHVAAYVPNMEKYLLRVERQYMRRPDGQLMNREIEFLLRYIVDDGVIYTVMLFEKVGLYSTEYVDTIFSGIGNIMDRLFLLFQTVYATSTPNDVETKRRWLYMMSFTTRNGVITTPQNRRLGHTHTKQRTISG